MRKGCFYLICLFCLVSCTANKNAPDWIQSQEHNPAYFSSLVHVKTSIPKYKDMAREMAANDIAMQISTYIETETQVSQTEIMGISHSEYISHIRSSSSTQLKNLSPLKSYETGGTYYVLYRLNKAEYYTDRARQRDLAISRAQDLIAQYDSAAEQPGIAIPYLLSALDLISEYLDMNLSSPKGNIAGEIFLRLNQLTHIIDYRWNTGTVSAIAKANKSITLEAKVIHHDSGEALSNIPLGASSESIVFSNPRFGDPEGRYIFPVDRIDSLDPIQRVDLYFDKDHYSSLLQNQAALKIWQAVNFNTKSLEINVSKPLVFLDYAYLSAFQGGYRESVAGALANLNIGIAAKLDEAEYLLKIRIEAKPGKYINNMKHYTSLADIRLSLIDPVSGATVNYLEHTDLKSGAATREEAERNAERDSATLIGDSLLYRLLYMHLLK